MFSLQTERCPSVVLVNKSNTIFVQLLIAYHALNLIHRCIYDFSIIIHINDICNCYSFVILLFVNVVLFIFVFFLIQTVFIFFIMDVGWVVERGKMVNEFLIC